MAVLDEAAVGTGGRWKPYPAYRDSGLDWLGDVPARWSDVRVKEHTTLVSGFPFDSELFSRTAGIPLIRIRDLESDATEAFFEGPPVDSVLVDTGDLIVGMDGDFNVALWRGERALLNQRLCCLRPKSSVDRRFLYYVLPLHLRRINDVTWSTTIKHISSAQIQRVRISLPPMAEQRAIVAFLDRETARIDALIAKKERLIELLAERRSATISGAFDQRWPIVPLRRALSRIEQGWSPVADDRPAEPTEWAVVKLSAIKHGRFVPHEHKALPAGTEALPHLEIRPGDFLMTRANTPELVGDVCVVGQTRDRLLLSDLVYRLGLRDDVVGGEFLKYFLLSREGRSQIAADARGSSQSMVKIAQGHIRSWLIPVPDLRAQRAVVALLDEETAQTDALVAKVRDHIALLREYRAALISAAVTGKIDVRDEVAA